MAKKPSKPASKPASDIIEGEAPQRCGNFWIRPSAVQDVIELPNGRARVELKDGHGVPGVDGDSVVVHWPAGDVRRVFGL